jgi:hypothetical protein
MYISRYLGTYYQVGRLVHKYVMYLPVISPTIDHDGTSIIH